MAVKEKAGCFLDHWLSRVSAPLRSPESHRCRGALGSQEPGPSHRSLQIEPTLVSICAMDGLTVQKARLAQSLSRIGALHRAAQRSSVLGFDGARASQRLRSVPRHRKHHHGMGGQERCQDRTAERFTHAPIILLHHSRAEVTC